MTSDGDDRRATQEATDWLIALREEPDDAVLRARFEAWRAASAANGVAWMVTCRVYDLIGETKPAVRPGALPVRRGAGRAARAAESDVEAGDEGRGGVHSASASGPAGHAALLPRVRLRRSLLA